MSEKSLKRTWRYISLELNTMQTFVLLSSTTLSFAIYLFVFFCLPYRNGIVSAQLTGSQETCDAEDESINVTDVSYMKCFDCSCKNGFVQCQRRKCPDIEGCYLLEDLEKDECCQKCKGCTKDNVYHASGTEWTELKNPCKVFTCTSGVITESLVQCYTPCDNPLPPKVGQCCSTCPDCHLNGTKVTKDIQISPKENPCITCKCDRGTLACMKKACPILNCPKSKIVQGFEECCPQCSGSGKYMIPPKGACLLGTTVYQNEKQFILDECSHCSCNNSTLHCEKKNCPILRCKRQNQETLPGQCCAECKEPIEIPVHEMKDKVPDESDDEIEDDIEEYDEVTERGHVHKHSMKIDKSCNYADKVYKNGEIWETGTCETCNCTQGISNCKPVMCPAIHCPPNSVLKILDGQCCPTCEESQGVCTVFGGSHFRTFDGKVYAFIGACKYQLVNDCDDGTFGIRLKFTVTGNDATIKRISLKLENVKVDLQQNKNTKVNDKIVDLPYKMKNKLNIKEMDDSIEVTTKIGVKVHWSYVGFLEVTVPRSYRRQLCGLCGNFNSIPSDDLTTREGIIVDSPAVFAQSWTAQGDEECLDTREYGVRGCNPEKDHRLCNYIKGSVFHKCLKKINVTSYYETCLKDMCECPPEDQQCHCESFASYVRDCRRLGILLPRWRKSVGC